MFPLRFPGRITLLRRNPDKRETEAPASSACEDGVSAAPSSPAGERCLSPAADAASPGEPEQAPPDTFTDSRVRKFEAILSGGSVIDLARLQEVRPARARVALAGAGAALFHACAVCSGC